MKRILLFLMLAANVQAAQQIQLVTPEFVSLGRLREGTVVTDSLLFINRTRKAITIRNVESSCGCTVPQYSKETIEPGDTAQVAYELKTGGFQGLIRKSLTVNFKESEIKPVTFLLEFQVYTDLDVTPRYIHFKNVRVNPDTLISAEIVIRNYSDKAIRLEKIYSKAKEVSVQPSRAVLNPEDEIIITISFRAVKHMMLMDYIIFETDFERKTRLEIPVFSQIEQ